MLKKFKNPTLIVGFMLFALFFGAGNLTFPAFLGLYSGQHFWQAIIGFCITGIGLPLLGVTAVAFSGHESPQELALPVSKWYALLFAAILYLSIGPFFAIPRTGATSFSIGIEPIFGNSLLVRIIYAFVFFGLSYFLAVKPSQIAEYIGKYLTPILISILGILIVVSFINPIAGLGEPRNASETINNAFKDSPFVAGLIQGYGTMDALASLAFAILVINAIKDHGISEKQEVGQNVVKSGLIACFLLSLVYVFIGHIGATSQGLFTLKRGIFELYGIQVDGGHILNQSAAFYLGNLGQTLLSVVIFLACLTTSSGLITACSEFFHHLMPKVSHVTWVTVFMLMSTLFYFGGLSEIVKWSTPFLYLLYPLTIALILLVFTKSFFANHSFVYQTTITATFIAGFYDFAATLGTMTGFFQLPDTMKHFFTTAVPLGQYNMGWIIFTLVGYLIGLSSYHFYFKNQ
ncbi:branched-chain amino acid transport system II carrier protein [Streptococcus pluranimalium]|uniref:branched-chain amino acid transport system II carrier protein n=1 Tax=Streptococcus pluranimalium TaxID=82348 RepID=UPI0039FD5E8D